MTRVLTPQQLNEEIAQALEPKPTVPPKSCSIQEAVDYVNGLQLSNVWQQSWSNTPEPQCKYCSDLVAAWRLKDGVLMNCGDLALSRMKDALESFGDIRGEELRGPTWIFTLDEREAALELSRICYYALTGEVVQVKMEVEWR